MKLELKIYVINKIESLNFLLNMCFLFYIFLVYMLCIFEKRLCLFFILVFKMKSLVLYLK